MVYLKVFERAYGEILSDVQARWSIQFRPQIPSFARISLGIASLWTMM